MTGTDNDSITSQTIAGNELTAPKGWRLFVGSILIVMNIGSVFCIPLVNSSNLSNVWKATLSGLLVVGIPQVFLVLAVAVVGKSGMRFIISKITAAVSRVFPSAREVGPLRHRIGLVMFFLPIIMAIVGHYLGGPILTIISFDELHAATLFDLMFLTSFFVLGGDFFDKLCALFVREARVIVPRKSPAATTQFDNRS